MSRLTTRTLHELVGANDLILRSSVLAAGFDRSVWHRAITRGDLVEVARGIAVMAGTRITQVVRIAATVASSGPGSMASHRSAAFLWGVHPIGDRPVDIIRPGGRILVDPPGHRIVTHRPNDATTIAVVNRFDVPVTPPARTLVDVASVLPSKSADLMTEMRIAGLVTVADIEEELARRPINAPGMVATRDALHAQLLMERPPDSVLEARFAELWRRFALPPMEFQQQIAGHRVDFFVRQSRIVIECDGFEFHGRDPRRVELDRQRDADLVRAGCRVLRFTWRMITQSPDVVAQTIQSAIESSSLTPRA